MPNWLLYSLVSAFFAALTAIFAKAGLKEVNSTDCIAEKSFIGYQTSA